MGTEGRRTMRKARRTAASAVLGLLVGMTLMGTALAQSATPTGSASPSQGSGITFVEGTVNDMRTINPFKALETPEFEVLSLNYDMLENFAQADLGPAPGLATDWTTSEDQLTWTFNIRSGVTWQDGEPLTANDIAYTYNTVLDCHLGNQLSYLPFTDSVTATSATTLEWKTTVPTVAPTLPPWVYIVPEHIWGSMSCDELKKAPNFEDGKPVIGSGPFQLTAWTKGESWTMQANKDYWAGAPHIDTFVVRKFNNAEAMVTALKNGEIDYAAALSPDLFNQLANDSTDSITTWVGPATGFTQMSFNMCFPDDPNAAPYCVKNGSTGHPALQDPVVRTAIATAIDRQTLVDKVLAGYGEAGTTIVPPFAVNFHYEPTPEELATFDIAKANQMLEDAGYVDTNDDGIREMPGGGQELDFRFILRSESDTGPKTGEYVTGWLKQIGIKTESEVVTDNKLVSAWYANDYDMYIWGWAPDPDPDFILSTFTSDQCGGWSDTCYSNPAYNDLYSQQQTATTLTDRQAIINQMQQIIYKDNPELVLYYDKDLEAYNSAKWTGLEAGLSPEPDGFLWNQYTPYSALTLAPVGSGGTVKSSGISPLVWVGILGAVIVVIAIVLLARRGKSDEDAA